MSIGSENHSRGAVPHSLRVLQERASFDRDVESLLSMKEEQKEQAQICHELDEAHHSFTNNNRTRVAGSRRDFTGDNKKGVDGESNAEGADPLEIVAFKMFSKSGNNNYHTKPSLKAAKTAIEHIGFSAL